MSYLKERIEMEKEQIEIESVVGRRGYGNIVSPYSWPPRYFRPAPTLKERIEIEVGVMENREDFDLHEFLENKKIVVKKQSGNKERIKKLKDLL